MKNYSNWSSGSKWLFGLLTGGVGNIILKSIDNIGNAVNEMSEQRKQSEKDFEDALTGQDVVSDIGDLYNSSSDNPYLSYRNGSSMPNFESDVDNPWSSWLNSKTGAGLTNNERIKMMYETWERQQAENFNHNEAVDARNYEMYMAQNKYQMETQSMAAAGVNPAMVYGGGSLVPTAATGTAGSSSPQSAPSAPTTGSLSGLIDVLSTIMRLPLEMKSINADIARSKAEAARSEQEGNAATMNAETNRMNAESNARQAAVAERQATVAEMRQQVDAAMADSNMSVNEATKTHIAKQCSILEKQYLQMDAYLDIEKVKANAQEKQALASLKQAAAAVQNAATNDYLSNYQSSLMYAQELVAWADGEGKEIVNKYLDENQKQTLDNLRKQNLILDEQGRLIHKQGNLATAQMVREYVNCATDIANSVSRFTGININTGALGTGKVPGASVQPSQLDPGAYGM